MDLQPLGNPSEIPMVTFGPYDDCQDYITERVASFLGIDLAALDPDGTGEEGGMYLGE